MRKVIDSNFLQSPELRRYLETPGSYAVITDYAAMEAYKGDTLVSIFRSMEILADHPDQVIILKPTQGAVEVLGWARSPEFLIDRDQTKTFAGYCRHLVAAKCGDASLQRQLLKMGEQATDHLDRMLAEAVPMPEIYDEIAQNFTRSQLAAIRKRADFDQELIDKIVKLVMDIVGILLKKHPRVTRWPDLAELPDTFAFRYALSSFLLALRWISVGGARDIRPERIRNDMVDMTFASYATYFDGLLTADRKLQELYDDTTAWLDFLQAVCTRDVPPKKN
jgi:hypothetical protein